MTIRSRPPPRVDRILRWVDLCLQIAPGLLWSDGSPLSAEDFVYSFRRVVDPATASSYAYMFFPLKNAEEIVAGKIKDLSRLGVDAPDPRTCASVCGGRRPICWPNWRITISCRSNGPMSKIRRRLYPARQSGVERRLHPRGMDAAGANRRSPRITRYHDAANVHIDKVIFYPISSPNEELNRYSGRRTGHHLYRSEFPSRVAAQEQ